MITPKWNGRTMKGQMRLVFGGGTLASQATWRVNANVIVNIKVDVTFKRDEIRFTANA